MAAKPADLANAYISQGKRRLRTGRHQQFDLKLSRAFVEQRIQRARDFASIALHARHGLDKETAVDGPVSFHGWVRSRTVERLRVGHSGMAVQEVSWHGPPASSPPFGYAGSRTA